MRRAISMSAPQSEESDSAAESESPEEAGAPLPDDSPGPAPEAEPNRVVLPDSTESGSGPLTGPAAIEPSAVPAPGPDAEPSELLRSEFDFELPRGYVDASGMVHRHGTMRLATARDELVPLRDPRVQENPAYLSVVLLGRVVTRLGTLPEVNDAVVEDMFASDLAFLQDFYGQINSEGHTRASVTCPSCQSGFEVELGGSRLGE